LRKAKSTAVTAPNTPTSTARLVEVVARMSPFSRFTICASPCGSAARKRMVSAAATA